MMKKIFYSFIQVMLGMLIISCAAGPHSEETINFEPDWVKNPPTSREYLYAVGIGEESDNNKSYDRIRTIAVAKGRAELARQITSRVESLTKLFVEEISTGQHSKIIDFFSMATRIITAETLNMSRIAKQETRNKDNRLIIFMLIELPFEKCGQSLMGQIKKDESIYTILGATKAFEELDKEVSKLNNR